MNNSVFGNTMENVRKHRDIKLVTRDKRRNLLVSEPNYHTIKWFSEDLIATEMKKTKVKMNKPIYLGLLILDLSKIVIVIWTQIALLFIFKLKDFIKILQMMSKKDLIHQIMKSIDYYLKENKKVIGLMKDELGSKIKIEFVALRTKTYSYLMDDDSEGRKAKGTKKCVIKRILKFNDYKDCLLNNEIILKSQQRFKS